MSNELIDLCQEMISIPSLNPQDRQNFQTPYGEEQMVHFVSDWCKTHSLDAEIQPVANQRNNVIVSAPGQDGSKTLLLCAHTDTVGTDGMTIDPFKPILQDNKLYGRGSCDTKASLACMLLAFHHRVNAGPLPYNLMLLASCGEEHNMIGAKTFAQNHGHTISAAIFGEPTELKTIVCHKGSLRLKVATHGKSVHSSQPDAGRNAIYTMAKEIQKIEAFSHQRQKETDHPLLGHETLAITMMDGGKQLNIIPNQCQAYIEWRYLPKHNANDCREALSKVLESTTEINILNYFSPMQTNPDHSMVKQCRQSTDKICHHQKVEGVSYATDASAFDELDFPKIILGPGNIAQAHTKDEFIKLDQLKKGLDVYKTYLANDWGI